MRQITLTVDLNDEEFAAFLARVGSRAVTQDDDEDAAPAADAGTPPVCDKLGTPWDERIHSANRTLTAEGRWRRRKGVDAAAAEKLEAELRQTEPEIPESLRREPVAPAPAATEAPAPTMPQMPAMPPVSIPQAPPPVSYEDVVAKFTECNNRGCFSNPGVIGDVYTAAGVTDVNELATNETLRARVMAELNKL